MSRFVFSEMPPLYADLAALQMRLALIKLARKYREDQPRAPAGSRDGGQWTEAGGSVRAVANGRSKNRTITGPAAKPVSRPRPLDAISYRAGDGTQFDAPPTADFKKMHEYGQNLQGKSLEEQKAAIGAAIGQGGIFDFQRKNGKFISDYTNASNYGVGVLMNGTGASWSKTFTAGAVYGLLNSRPAYDANRVAWWYRGYQDAQNSRLPGLHGK